MADVKLADCRVVCRRCGGLGSIESSHQEDARFSFQDQCPVCSSFGVVPMSEADLDSLIRERGGEQLPERIIAKIDRSGECWIWTASTNRRGYGVIKVDGAARKAHRVVYEILVGPIPEGLSLDHLCRQRACVNPDHLEPVSLRTNTLRGDGLTAKNARKTHCKWGHEFTEENTYLRPKGRECVTCKKRRDRERGQRQKARAALLVALTGEEEE